MPMLAIEMSTRDGSVALLRDGNEIASAAWHDAHRPGQNLFTELPGLLRAGGTEIKDVDVFAAGLGPGSYAGLRIAVTAARAMAMPRGKAVYGVNSAAVIAFELMRERRVKTVMVIGDARRGRLWSGLFEMRDGAPEAREPEWLMPAYNSKIALPAGCLAATPDWDRIGEMLIENVRPPEGLICEPARPKATALGELAFLRMQKGLPSEPFAPVYMSAAVERTQKNIDNPGFLSDNVY